MQTIINQQIPDFSVDAFVDGDFKTITSADLKGKWAILFSIPPISLLSARRNS